MPICAIVNHKGGVGKTTLSTNIAVGLHKLGNRVLLVDSDPQGSARDWSASALESGNNNPVTVIGLDRPTLNNDIPKISPSYDWTIIDGAARDGVLTAQAISVADYVLIPVRPSPYDCWAITDLVETVKQRQAIANGQPLAAFVLSSAIVGTNIGDDVREVLNGYELETFNSCTHNRVIYAKSAIHGLSVLDAEPTSTAALEVNEIVRELLSYESI